VLNGKELAEKAGVTPALISQLKKELISAGFCEIVAGWPVYHENAITWIKERTDGRRKKSV